MNALRLLAVSFVFLSVGVRGSACAACFGRSDSPLAQGMNWGIITLLFFVLGLWAAFGSFFVFIARRSAKTPLPGESDPIHSPGDHQS